MKRYIVVIYSKENIHEQLFWGREANSSEEAIFEVACEAGNTYGFLEVKEVDATIWNRYNNMATGKESPEIVYAYLNDVFRKAGNEVQLTDTTNAN